MNETFINLDGNMQNISELFNNDINVSNLENLSIIRADGGLENINVFFVTITAKKTPVNCEWTIAFIDKNTNERLNNRIRINTTNKVTNLMIEVPKDIQENENAILKVMQWR